MKEIAVFISASETHNLKNVNKTVAATLEEFGDVIGPAVSAGLRVRGYVSTLWGCPYEGEIDPRAGVRIARALLEAGCYQVSLGDTIGCGTPRQTSDILELFLSEFEPGQLAMHMHDTRGTALANVLVGLEAGLRTFDASVGGAASARAGVETTTRATASSGFVRSSGVVDAVYAYTMATRAAWRSDVRGNTRSLRNLSR